MKIDKECNYSINLSEEEIRLLNDALIYWLNEKTLNEIEVPKKVEGFIRKFNGLLHEEIVSYKFQQFR